MTETNKKQVLIFDTTLRDGEQSPGATMSLSEKIEIAILLDEMGVDIIEAGFPIASEGDFEAVSEISKVVKNSAVCGLSRANYQDIDRCWQAIKGAKSPRIHTFIGTSPLHREFQVRLNKQQVLEKVEETVAYARNLCNNVQWSPMDATRTESDFLCEVVRVAIRAGAKTINIPDTVGYTAPTESGQIIKMLYEEIPELSNITVSTHCHNDLGMATANALAAVEAGARQIECTINGLGERAGNTALEEVVMAIRVRNDLLPYKTNIKSKKLMQLSRLVAKVSGFPVQFNKAIVGKNAFAHESGIHQDGMLKHAGTFEIMKPDDIGLSETNLVMGKHSGRAALKKKITDLGYTLRDNELHDLFVRYKALADRKKEIYDEDLIALMTDNSMNFTDDLLSLTSLTVTCGTEGPQKANINLSIKGENYEVETIGDGPVDAVFKSINKIFSHSANLQHFQIHSVTEGTDAQATVSVRLEELGKIVTGQASDTDTVVASAKAYINALNKLTIKRQKKAPDSITH